MYGDPFADAWPGLRPRAHRLRLHARRSRPDETAALVTFVVKGLSEVYDPRGGYPIPRPGRAARHVRAIRSTPAPTRRIPAPGSEIARVTEQSRAGWPQTPDLRGLTPLPAVADRQLGRCAPRAAAGRSFTVFEKTVSQLQDGDDHGAGRPARTSSASTWPALSLYDRHGPTFQRGAGDQPARHRRCPRPRCRARGRPRARSVSRRADRLQGQHRRDRTADHRRLAGARSIIARASIRASPPA